MNGVGVAFSASSLLGPIGGLIGLAFGAGASAGWFFAIRTVYKIVTKERESCEKRVTILEEQVRALNERYTAGMERQLGQIRQSTVRILRDDEPI